MRRDTGTPLSDVEVCAQCYTFLLAGESPACLGLRAEKSCLLVANGCARRGSGCHASLESAAVLGIPRSAC